MVNNTLPQESLASDRAINPVLPSFDSTQGPSSREPYGSIEWVGQINQLLGQLSVDELIVVHDVANNLVKNKAGNTDG